jgi:hypothetical protein
MDSASLFAADKRAAEENRKNRAAPLARPLPRATMPVDLNDARITFNDPGRSPGPSILCPEIYEALRRKGYSKERAAKISNAQCNK